MDSVKRLFGALMLALAAWMLGAHRAGALDAAAVRRAGLAAAIVLWGFVPVAHARRAIRAGGDRAATSACPAPVRRCGGARAALLVALYALALLLGAARGADDPLHPLAGRSAATDEPAFTSISSVADLQREVQAAAAAHQAVMLDFYADWCTSCKEMQRYTFTDPQVRDALQVGAAAARRRHGQQRRRSGAAARVPDLRSADHRLLRCAAGTSSSEYRVVGYMKAAEFAALLHQALASG